MVGKWEVCPFLKSEEQLQVLPPPLRYAQRQGQDDSAFGDANCGEFGAAGVWSATGNLPVLLSEKQLRILHCVQDDKASGGEMTGGEFGVAAVWSATGKFAFF